MRMPSSTCRSRRDGAAPPRPAGRCALVLSSALALAVGLPAGAVAAAAPEKFGPFVEDYDLTWDCDGFEAAVSGTSTTRFTAFFDRDGTLTRLHRVTHAPSDLIVNTTTGASVVLRGHFTVTFNRVGTDTFTRTITGFRYMVNEPGSGVTVQEVGRIVYAPDQQTVLAIAGQHDLIDDSAVEPALCALVA